MPRQPAIISAQGASQTPVARATSPATPLARLRTGDRLTQGAQDAADAATRAARSSPIGDGNLIKDVSFTANTATVINHRLGAKWSGWVVTKTTNGGVFKYVAQASNLDDKQITMQCNVTCTCDLWVFK